jgi:single-strand DNA-binding protein
LEMNTIERDGYKEKRARLVATRLYHVMATDATEPAAPMSAATPSAAPVASTPKTSAPASTPASTPRNEPPPNFEGEDIDNIPF